MPPSRPATTLRPELCPGGGGDLPHWGLTVSQVSGPSGKAASSKTSCSPSCLPVRILDFSPWATCCCSAPPTPDALRSPREAPPTPGQDFLLSVTGIRSSACPTIQNRNEEDVKGER